MIHSYPLQHGFLSTGCNEYEYNVGNKLIPYEIYLNKFRKIFIILINDSSDSNHQSKCTVLVVVLQKKKKKKDKANKESKHTTFY